MSSMCATLFFVKNKWRYTERQIYSPGIKTVFSLGGIGTEMVKTIRTQFVCPNSLKICQILYECSLPWRNVFPFCLK